MTSTSNQDNQGAPPSVTQVPSNIPDPRTETCPNFRIDFADTVAELAASRGHTDDQVIKALEDQWKERHSARCSAWLASQGAAPTPDPPSEASAGIDFNDNKVVETRLAFRPCTYAKNEVDALRYCPLWYFTTEGAKKISGAVQEGLVSSLSLAEEDGVMTLRPTAAVKASKNAIPDSKLTWDQFDVASRRFVDYVASSSSWGTRGAEAMYDLFNNLKDHDIREQEGGRIAIQRYAEDLRIRFHDDLKSCGADMVFNPGIINEERLSAYLRNVVHEQGIAVNKEFERRLAEFSPVCPFVFFIVKLC
jgi:hypothetical protein